MRLQLFLLFWIISFHIDAQPNQSVVAGAISTGDNYFTAKRYENAAQSYQVAMSQLLLDFNTQHLSAQPNSKQLELCSQKELLLQVLEKKVDVLIALEKRGIALQTINTADYLIDIMRKNHAGRGKKSFWRTKTHSLYEKALDLTFTNNSPQKAFYFLEKSKAVLFLDVMTFNRNFLPDSLIRQEEDLLNAAALARKAAANDKTKHPDYLQTKRDFENFQKFTADNYPLYYALHYDITVPDLKESGAFYSYQNATQYIHFFYGKNHIYTLLFGAEKTKMHRIPNTTQTNALIMEFSQKYNPQPGTVFDYSDFAALPFEVYDILLKDLFPDDNFPEQLVLLYEGTLSRLPFKKLKIKANSVDSKDNFSQHTKLGNAYSIKNLKDTKNTDYQNITSPKEDILPLNEDSNKSELKSPLSFSTKTLIILCGLIGLFSILITFILKRRKSDSR